MYWVLGLFVVLFNLLLFFAHYDIMNIIFGTICTIQVVSISTICIFDHR